MATRSYRRVDFKALRREIQIEAVCDLLGIQLKRMANGQMRGHCIICGHESERAFVVTPSVGLFYCFADCKNGGDIIALTAAVKQLTLTGAARFLVDHLGSS